MNLQLRIKAIFILVAIILATWQLSYTFRYSRLTTESKALLPEDELKKLKDRSIKLGLDLQGGMHLVLEADIDKLSPDERKEAVKRMPEAMEILRNRIDEFGVSEPHIARQGLNRIVIELPGIVEKERAKEIIQKTAMLEFRIVEREETTIEVFKKIDALVRQQEIKAAMDSLKDTLSILDNPLVALVSGGRVLDTDIPLVEKYLSMEGVSQFIPVGDTFLWSTLEKNEVEKTKELLLVNKEACITGDEIVNAQAGIGTNDNPLGSRVDLTMSGAARGKWSRVTGSLYEELKEFNRRRRIAIVLDNIVQSAPVVMARIGGGKSVIEMGTSPFKEAQDLALIIRAGRLPVPLKFAEERTIGPSLGADSIRKGMFSGLIGAGIILLFMVVYYKFCGIIADIALALNIFFLLAILAAMRGTLTMPGIAGIILSIGSAVDANILIYERIKEELRSGKTLRAGIDAGYTRAFSAIFDGNVTTILAAIILYYFGTGPVKGFGITLLIGQVVNLFTAVTVTKVILDYLTFRGMKRISV